MKEEKALQKSILSVVNEIKGKKISSESDYIFATDWLKKNKATQKIVTAAFEEDIQEAKLQLQKVKASLESFLLPLSESEASVKKQILSYQEEARKQVQEAEEKLRIAEEKGRTSKTLEKHEVAIQEMKSNLPPKTSGISTRKIWTFSITNESLLPREYLIPDTKKLGEIARQQKEKASIPGVEFLFEEILAVG